MVITVSVLPQKYFVERIGDGYVNVNVMVGPGSDPHTYEPKPEQMRDLSKSKAYFSVGVEFEKAWLDKFTDINPGMVIIDTSKGIEPLSQTNPTDDNEILDKHSTEVDTHIWTSPILVKIQAQAVCDALTALDPGHSSIYRKNLDGFLSEIDALDINIRDTLSGIQNREFIVFHPAWGYFARDYDLVQIPVEVGGQEPSAAELANVISIARNENVKVIFAQPEFSTRSAEVIADEIGGEVLLIDPLAYNWKENIEHVARTFASVLK